MLLKMKLEYKIAIAFMLPVIIVMIVGLFGYYSNRIMVSEYEIFQSEANQFVEKVERISEGNLSSELIDDIEQYKQSIKKHEQVFFTTAKKQLMIQLVIVQIGIIPIILIGVLLARYLQKYIDMESSKESSTLRDDEFVKDIMKTVILKYKEKTDADTDALIDSLKVELKNSSNSYRNF